MLATFYLDANGSFFISGTYVNDVMVATVAASEVRVTVNSTTQTRPIAAINELVFMGLGGDDHITNNTSIPSRMYGGNGNDTLIGGFGNDRLVGNAGNDNLQGRDGNDILRGSLGSNTMDGGNGDDFLYGGYEGRNKIYGGAGNDVIYAGNQGDEIFGQAGNDQLFGGLGDDLMFGGTGEDLIMGWHGNDSLYAEGANNRLYGGTGNDGLFAGLGSGNLVFPNDGKDRILVAPGQSVSQFVRNMSADDVEVRFANRSASWNYLEIEALDRGLRALHHRSNGTKILRDSTTSDPMTIYKYQSNDPVIAGNPGWNYNAVEVTVFPNGTHSATYSREIRMADFDENNSHAYRYAGLLLIHEISHSWDSLLEINRVAPALGSHLTQFQALSGWTSQNPNSSLYRQAPGTTQEVVEYQVVGNQITIPTRQWWYLANSTFTRSYGASNAKEDWAVTWEMAFVEEVYGPASSLGLTLVPAKVGRVNAFLAGLS